MYKFRTMIPNAEAQLEELLAGNEMDGPAFKIRRDPRITRLGYFLRRSSIDELPQLWIVLRGEMSLVGPRPALPREVAMYDDRTRLRLKVRPGITGLWQISGRSDTDYSQRVALDTYYVLNWSPWLDIWIVVRTVWKVLSMRGAY
jgi:lipopolysaccharide/colanic/teichoic acid biosynthesis glycosyltransferase